MCEPLCSEIELRGCTPEPLLAYLKSLGILRVVSEQKDPQARGWWTNDTFCLRSRALFDGKNSDAEKLKELVRFFLRDYQPTPLVAPWNAGSGFYLKWDDKARAFKQRGASRALVNIESSSAKRFQRYRQQITAIKKALRSTAEPVNPETQIAEVRERGRREGWSKKKTDSELKKLLDGQMLFSADDATFGIQKLDKDELVRTTRSALMTDEGVRWLDAAFVLRTGQKKNRIEAPLLGSGGNIGNSDFSARFMEILALCLPLNNDTEQGEQSATWLANAVMGYPTAGLEAIAVDQFDPGRAGGANMYQGLEAGFRLNPWDYILMLEGAILLQSASSRRLGTIASGSAFPFTVESAAAGFTSSGFDGTRGEQWLPLWHRPCCTTEIESLLAEGRSDVGSKRSRTAVDFVRAATSLGVDRGIRQFVRIQYQTRFGDNYLANALGRVDVVERRSVDLLREIDNWLGRFRSACSAKNAPARFSSALRAVESAVFDYCKYGGESLFQQILVSLGWAERELSRAKRFREEQKIRPISGLSYSWADAANDGSMEFILARALAGVRDLEGKIGPLRANLEAVDWALKCRAWAETDGSVVWNSAELATNLSNVLERRVMEGRRNGCKQLPLASPLSVPIDGVAAFLDGALGDERIQDLIWALMLVDPRSRNGLENIDSILPTIPSPLARDYALLKLLFLPGPIAPTRTGNRVQWRLNVVGEGGITVRPEPRIFSLLRAGRAGEACRIAAQRLRVYGLIPMPGSVHGRFRDDAWSENPNDVQRGGRLAAALLIPISSKSVNHLIHLVCREESSVIDALATSTEGEPE